MHSALEKLPVPSINTNLSSASHTVSADGQLPQDTAPPSTNAGYIAHHGWWFPPSPHWVRIIPSAPCLLAQSHAVFMFS